MPRRNLSGFSSARAAEGRPALAATQPADCKKARREKAGSAVSRGQRGLSRRRAYHPRQQRECKSLVELNAEIGQHIEKPAQYARRNGRFHFRKDRRLLNTVSGRRQDRAVFTLL